MGMGPVIHILPVCSLGLILPLQSISGPGLTYSLKALLSLIPMLSGLSLVDCVERREM